MKEIKVMQVISPSGEEFLVETVTDRNPLPQVKVFKQVKNALKIAERDFEISRERPNTDKKSKMNTREVWNEIFKKGTFILLIFSLFAFSNCSKNFTSETDVLKLIQNSEWKDDVIKNVDQSTISSKYYYFDSNKKCYTNYYKPGDYKANEVQKYNYDIKLSTAKNGEQTIQIVLSGGFNPPLLYLKSSNTNQMVLFETTASFSEGSASSDSETRDLNRVN